MAKCLIVGANGFIGSHLVDQLAANGHYITAFDRFSAGRRSYTASNVRQFVGDFTNPADLESALKGQQYVFHMLSTTSPIIAEDDPSLDIRSNVALTVDFLQMCVREGIDRFFYASTGGAIYGAQDHRSFAESDPTAPVSPYAIGKLSIENYLRYFRVKHGLKSVIFRISNPYGTRQHPRRLQGLIPIVARQLALNKPVTRFGDGSMVRDYVYIEDLVRMIARTVGLETEFDVYNLGSGKGLTVNTVLECLASISGTDLRIIERAVPSTFIHYVVLNTHRFESEFGTLDLTPLDRGARTVINEARDAVASGSAASHAVR